MQQGYTTLPAVVGVFFGSLLSNWLFDNDIQSEDLFQAAVLALTVGVFQLSTILGRSR